MGDTTLNALTQIDVKQCGLCFRRGGLTIGNHTIRVLRELGTILFNITLFIVANESVSLLTPAFERRLGLL